MGAVISSCGQYRYFLARYFTQETPVRPAIFIMLNPSTADASIDDPTIRRCKTFAVREGCDALYVLNLYALRATDPTELKRHPDPVGPANDTALELLVPPESRVICAWGALAPLDRVLEVLQVLKGARASTWCLGVTKDGSPRHPLYLPLDAPLQSFTFPPLAINSDTV